MTLEEHLKQLRQLVLEHPAMAQAIVAIDEGDGERRPDPVIHQTADGQAIIFL